VVCLAASRGAGARGRGWPDALTAGPWCGRFGGVAADVRGPDRALPPVERSRADAVDVDGQPSAHDAVPVLLVEPGAARLPEVVTSFLADAFDPSGPWCSGRRVTSCVVPGFAVAFGGASNVSAAQLRAASDLVGGGPAPGHDGTPVLTRPFVTDLDLTPTFSLVGAGDRRVCVPRAAMTDVRWLATYGDSDLLAFVGASDVAAAAVYRDDLGVEVPSEPVCVAVPPADVAAVVGVSLSGHRTDITTVDLDADHRLTMSDAMTHTGAVDVAGAPPDSDVPGQTTTFTWADAGPPGVAVTERGRTSALRQVTAVVTVSRTATGVDRFTASLTLETERATVELQATGEAVAEDGGWRLAGRSTDGEEREGGFVGTIVDGGDQGPVLTWRLDLGTVR
jgi:hypothetical protein